MIGISIRTKAQAWLPENLQVQGPRTLVCCSPRLVKNWVCPSVPSSVFRDISVGAWNPPWWQYFHEATAINHGSPFLSLRVDMREHQPGTPDLKDTSCLGLWGQEEAVKWGENRMFNGVWGERAQAMQCFSKWGPGERIKNCWEHTVEHREL